MSVSTNLPAATVILDDESTLELSDVEVVVDWLPTPEIWIRRSSPPIPHRRAVVELKTRPGDVLPSVREAWSADAQQFSIRRGTWHSVTSVPFNERDDAIGVRVTLVNFDGSEFTGARDFEFTYGEYSIELVAQATQSGTRVDGHYFPTYDMGIRRTGGGAISRSDFDGLEKDLSGMLGFFSGQVVGCFGPTAHSPNGLASYGWLGSRACSAWKSRYNWCDSATEGADLQHLATAWSRSDGETRETAWVLSRMVAEGQREGTFLQTRFVAAWMALERLAWHVVVDRERLLSRSVAAKATASALVRLVFHWCRADDAIPERHRALREMLDNDEQGLPEALAQVRNRIVHPLRKKGSAPMAQPESDAMIAAWLVALDILDLGVLRLVGYEGNYAARTPGRLSGVGRPVPWVVPPVRND